MMAFGDIKASWLHTETVLWLRGQVNDPPSLLPQHTRASCLEPPRHQLPQTHSFEGPEPYPCPSKATQPCPCVQQVGSRDPLPTSPRPSVASPWLHGPQNEAGQVINGSWHSRSRTGEGVAKEMWTGPWSKMSVFIACTVQIRGVRKGQ